MNQVTDTDVVIVTASRDRWRIGRQFKPKTPVTLKLVDLSETELKRLEDDPVLSLRFATATATDVQDDDPVPADDIVAAVLGLGPESFNKDGSPKVVALEAWLGRNLSKADVTAALAGLTDEQRDTLKERLKANDGGDNA